MNNNGFEVSLNGKLLCKAGLKYNHGVVCCIVDALLRKGKKEELCLNISGLNSDTGEHVKWFKSHTLKEHDVITIKIIKDNFDAPKEVGEKKI